MLLYQIEVKIPEHIHDLIFIGLQFRSSKISVNTVFPRKRLHDVYLLFINALYLNKHKIILHVIMYTHQLDFFDSLIQ